MKTKLLFTVTCLLLFTALGFSQGDSEVSRTSLNKLKGIKVAVALNMPKADELGLFESDLQTDVELRLSLAGIPVISKDSSVSPIHEGELLVLVQFVGDAENAQSYNGGHISLQLRQWVSLLPESKTITFATTWSDARIELVDRTQLKETIREQIKNLTDTFINAYLSVNPER
jgi:hypothetical protein